MLHAIRTAARADFSAMFVTPIEAGNLLPGSRAPNSDFVPIMININ
jgi:hypothetical protein